MTRPLSMDIRERAMARLEAGETVRAVADALSVAPSSVVKWSARKRSTGLAVTHKYPGSLRCERLGRDRRDVRTLAR